MRSILNYLKCCKNFWKRYFEGYLVQLKKNWREIGCSIKVAMFWKVLKKHTLGSLEFILFSKKTKIRISNRYRTVLSIAWQTWQMKKNICHFVSSYNTTNWSLLQKHISFAKYKYFLLTNVLLQLISTLLLMLLLRCSKINYF